MWILYKKYTVIVINLNRSLSFSFLRQNNKWYTRILYIYRMELLIFPGFYSRFRIYFMKWLIFLKAYSDMYIAVIIRTE